jgi:hypothetical protein
MWIGYLIIGVRCGVRDLHNRASDRVKAVVPTLVGSEQSR